MTVTRLALLIYLGLMLGLAALVLRDVLQGLTVIP